MSSLLRLRHISDLCGISNVSGAALATLANPLIVSTANRPQLRRSVLEYEKLLVGVASAPGPYFIHG